MAFFKKVRQPVNEKWYPYSILVGTPATTSQVAKSIASRCTVTHADVVAVLSGLADVLGDFMAEGRSVKLDGIGSFYFTAVSIGTGKDTPEEVTANQINGVRVRFRPETTYKHGGKKSRRAVRGLTDRKISWIDIDTLAHPAPGKQAEKAGE